MKKLVTFSGVLILCSFAGILTPSCKKKEIQGPRGEAGTPGGGGNSNISNSSIFTIGSYEWKPNTDSSAWQFTINSPLVTKDVADKGAVKVFVAIGTSWSELPRTKGDLFTQFSFQTGIVTLTFVDIHGGLPPKPSTADYRITTFSEGARSSNPFHTPDPETTIIF